MSDDLEMLPERERARVKSRDKKASPPKVVVDNVGLKKLALHLKEKRQARGPARRKPG